MGMGQGARGNADRRPTRANRFRRQTVRCRESAMVAAGGGDGAHITTQRDFSWLQSHKRSVRCARSETRAIASDQRVPLRQ